MHLCLTALLVLAISSTCQAYPPPQQDPWQMARRPSNTSLSSLVLDKASSSASRKNACIRRASSQARMASSSSCRASDLAFSWRSRSHRSSNRLRSSSHSCLRIAAWRSPSSTRPAIVVAAFARWSTMSSSCPRSSRALPLHLVCLEHDTLMPGGRCHVRRQQETSAQPAFLPTPRYPGRGGARLSRDVQG